MLTTGSFHTGLHAAYASVTKIAFATIMQIAYTGGIRLAKLYLKNTFRKISEEHI